MATANFVLSERTLDQRTLLLSLEGDTTAAAGGRLRQRLGQLGEKQLPLVIIDLSRVSFVDSAVVQALSDTAASLKRTDTRLLVVEPVDPMVAHPLELGRLDLVAEVVGTLGEAARVGNLPVEAVQPAIPPPPPLPAPTTKPKRTVFGRRRQDQHILRELGELRRFAQELRREAGMHQQVADDEIERRRAAEEALVQLRETEARRAAAAGEAGAGADEIAAIRAELDAARAEAALMEDEAEQAHTRIQALEGDLAAARAAADSVRGELEAGRSATEETHSRIQTVETDLARAQSEAEAMRRDLESARSDHGSRASAAVEEAASARAELERARAEADRMEAEAEAAHARIQALEAETLELRAALEQARVAANLADEEPPRPAAREAEEARRREAEQAQRQAEQARLVAEDQQRRAEAEADDARRRAEAEADDARRRADAEADDARRRAEAEEARRRAEEEAARAPRPKVPVWADPTPINVNDADVEELQLLPGIGRRPAERIVAFREQNGGFQSIDDLFAISDVPRDRIKRIRPYIRV